MKHRDSLFWLGLICLLIWIIDFFNIVFLYHKPDSLLWYSNAGLLATSISLLKRNSLLTAILFCALFMVELLWGIGFLLLIFSQSIPGLVKELALRYEIKDLVLTLYHFIIPPALLIGVLKLKKVHKHAWIGAFVYVATLSFLTYFLISPERSVNCVHPVENCRIFIPFLSTIQNPARIFIALGLLTIFVYIPSNYFLYKIGKHLKWE